MRHWLGRARWLDSVKAGRTKPVGAKKKQRSSFVVIQYTPKGADSVGEPRISFVQPNVGAKLPAEARSVSLVRDDASRAADQA